MSDNNQGKVVQVMGAVVDVKFNDHLPAILDSLEIWQNEQVNGQPLEVNIELKRTT